MGVKGEPALEAKESRAKAGKRRFAGKLPALPLAKGFGVEALAFGVAICLFGRDRL